MDKDFFQIVEKLMFNICGSIQNSKFVTSPKLATSLSLFGFFLGEWYNHI